MKKVTIKNYAVKRKLSIFNVMKMVRSGKLKSEVVEENGKEIIYIVIEDEVEKEIEKGTIPPGEQDEATLKMEIEMLKKEVAVLRKELEEVKKRL